MKVIIINTAQIERSIRYRIERLANRTHAERVFEEILKGFMRKLRHFSYVPERIFYMKDGGFYFADFYIEKPYHIVFEIDGGYHLNKRTIQHDVNRTLYMESDRGLKVFRFCNNEILENTKAIKQKVREILKSNVYCSISEHPDYNMVGKIETQNNWIPNERAEKEISNINQMLDNSFSMTV